MKFVLYTNIVSPHQLPLAMEIASRIGVENYTYIYTDDFHEQRAQMGWRNDSGGIRCLKGNDSSRELMEADVLFSGNRALSVFEARSKAGKKTFVFGERWFKPIPLRLFGLFSVLVPGAVRMFYPPYFRMAFRFVRLLRNDPGFFYYGMGIHACRDMRLICRMFGIDGERKIRLWGYMVEPGVRKTRPLHAPLRLLYVGRLLQLKRVDTFIAAIKDVAVSTDIGRIEATIVGDGPEFEKLKKIAQGLPIRFMKSQPIDKIRGIMREHDLLVFPSNGRDGWGAVVSEALEEGLRVVSTCETGAGASILPASLLYHSGNVKGLVCCIKTALGRPPVGIGDWAVEKRAEMLIKDAMQ